MQKHKSEPWWQQIIALTGSLIFVYFVARALLGSGEEPTPIAAPIPRATSSLPDYCWYTPDGIECDEPSYDERWAGVSDEALHGAEMEEAVREATIEALIDERWDAIGQQEAEAYATEEEHTRREATLEAELWGSGSVSASPASEVGRAPASEAAAGAEWAVLISVTDGDSIVVEIAGNDYRVRYIGMDTPEYGQYGSDQATDVNRQLLASGPLRLEKDVSETDQYGRLLRYVFAGDVFVNAELVRLGYAYADTWPPDVKYADYFVQLQREAREAGRGLWAE